MSTTTKILIAVGIAVASAAISLAIVAVVLVRIPADYFSDPKRRHAVATAHPALRVLRLILKNLLGIALVAAGIAMSVPGVPGQGILTILLGVMLMDFPGKYRLERWILTRPRVLTGINRLRARFGKEPLMI